MELRPSSRHGPIESQLGLQNRWGLLEVSPRNVVLTAFKPGPANSTVLRVYEASGKTTPGVKIKMDSGILAARAANLLEDAGRKLTVKTNTVEFNLHPFEIKTIQLQLRPAKP